MVLSEQDRQRVIELLISAFQDNQSVNYIIPQDAYRSERIRGLMEYAYRVCEGSGKVILTPDRAACALVLWPHTNKTSLKNVIRDLNFLIRVTGLRKAIKVITRESLIQKHHPATPFYYLWFIAVDSLRTGQGLGSALLEQLIDDANARNLSFYLETSTEKNIPWYRKFGFRSYHELDLGYKLHFMKR